MKPTDMVDSYYYYLYTHLTHSWVDVNLHQDDLIRAEWFCRRKFNRTIMQIQDDIDKRGQLVEYITKANLTIKNRPIMPPVDKVYKRLSKVFKHTEFMTNAELDRIKQECYPCPMSYCLSCGEEHWIWGGKKGSFMGRIDGKFFHQLKGYFDFRVAQIERQHELWRLIITPGLSRNILVKPLYNFYEKLDI